MVLANRFLFGENVVDRLQVRSHLEEGLAPRDQSGSLGIDGLQSRESYKFIFSASVAVLLGYRKVEVSRAIFQEILGSYFLYWVNNGVPGAKAPNNGQRHGVEEAPGSDLAIVPSFLLVEFFIAGLLIDNELENILMLDGAHEFDQSFVVANLIIQLPFGQFRIFQVEKAEDFKTLKELFCDAGFCP